MTGGSTDWMCPVREGGRDGARLAARGKPDDGKRDLKLSKMVDLDGKRKNFFLSPDMLVAIDEYSVQPRSVNDC